MFGARSTSKFGSWRLEGYPQVVEYAHSVIEQVMEEVAAGFRQFAHGGIAVGGVFFGEGDRHLVRILATRPMPCEHSAGPSFTLSENDHADLESVLSAAKEDPELEGMVPVGWFHSHTRSGLTLTPSDLVIHDRHFYEPWQIALVIRPEDDGPTRAGLFARQDDGSFRVRPTVRIDDLSAMPTDSVQISLPLTEMRAALEEEPAAAAEVADEPEVASGTPDSDTPFNETPADEPPAPAEEPNPVAAPNLFAGYSEAPEANEEKKSGRWIGIAAAAALAVGGLWAAGQFLTPPEYWQAVSYYKTSSADYLASVYDFWERKADSTTASDLALQAVGSGANLVIRWDTTSRAVAASTGGLLELDDGVQVERVQLTFGILVEGSYSHMRTGDDIGVKLTLFTESGENVEASTRFVGGVLSEAAPEALGADTPETLRAELESLRSAIARQSEQNAGMRATLQTLQQIRGSQTAAAASSPPPAAAALTPPSRPAPPVFQQKPANLPGASPGAPVSVAAKPAYRGAKSGRLIWTGFLANGQALVIGGSSASVGSLSGAFPGVPVDVSVAPGELTGGGLTVYSSNSSYQNSPATEEPSQKNAWNKTTIRYDSAKAQAAAVVEKPGPSNGWKRLSVRAQGRPLSVLVVSWSVIE